MSEKHYPYIGGSFDRIIFDGDSSVWVPEPENAKLRELVTKAHVCKTDEGCCEGCYQDEGCCPIEREMQELGIEVTA